VTVYAVRARPAAASGKHQRVTAAALALSLYYPDSPDVEALRLGGTQRCIWFRRARARRQHPPVPCGSRGLGRRGVVRAEFVQTLPIVPDGAAGRLVTGAAVRADGGLVAIRTYSEVYFFSPGPGGLLRPADRPVCSIAELERLGEGIGFLDDSSLVLTSEATLFGPGTIHTVRCPR
jgi:hypothetical protein